MKHLLITLLFLLSCLSLQAAGGRQLQYHPSGKGFVRENGSNRYSRALYGSHTNWRLETSDRPLFATYDKKAAWNIQFTLLVGAQAYRLDSTSYCQSYYEGGLRRYVVRDERWKGGEVRMLALAAHDSEDALWQCEVVGFLADSSPIRLKAVRCPIAKRKMKRNGDLGTDPRENFEAMPLCPDSLMQSLEWSAKGTTAVRLKNNERLEVLSENEAQQVIAAEQAWVKTLTAQLDFQTPDPLINTLGPTLMAAADGLWDGETWQHGCIGWRTPLAGWRGGYVGDVTGWSDRSKRHFRAYKASMVTDIEPVIPHPAQDTTKNLARSAEKWGTPMYSNGYICKLPNDDRKMSHYDMNLNYIDELMWHFQYDADTVMMREFWPAIQLHLAWEKRNWDPDGDHLYDGYCCIWASDALYYNSGAVTHASAYNYRGNLLAARIAELLGEDPSPYRSEADAILRAMNERLWVHATEGVDGHWAEFQDFMGLKRLHPNAALWSIYTPIDCQACSSEQAFQATRWVDACIPHIPLDLDGSDLFTLSTSDWMPYAWSTNNVAHEEVANMALAYFVAGRREMGYRLLYSDLMDEMCAGDCPGNFGQISYYDKALKEAYRDFGDNIGITSRAIVQGLFGIRPDALFDRCYLQPGFPQEWDSVRVSTPYFSYYFHRENGVDIYDVEQNFVRPLNVILRLPVGDGRFVEVKGDKSLRQRLTIASSALLDKELPAPAPYRPHLDVSALGLDDVTDNAASRHFYQPLTPYFNAAVDEIFRQQYLSPRSPYTTLEIPSQGMGDWCVPLMTAQIEDDGLRACIGDDGLYDTGVGLRFRLPRDGNNIVYTSLWDNYPDSIQIEPVSDEYAYAYLLMAGSTNNMQSRIENGLVTATYTDGTADTLRLVNPYNWCPIEQDYYYDDHAFWSTELHPYRVHLGSGMVSRSLKQDLQKAGKDSGAVNIHVTDFDADTPIAKGLSVPDGAAQILKMPLCPERKLKSLTLRTLSNDVVIGVMSVSLEKP